jgi:hypothetical protein
LRAVASIQIWAKPRRLIIVNCALQRNLLICGLGLRLCGFVGPKRTYKGLAYAKQRH